MRTIQFEFQGWPNSASVIRGAMSRNNRPVTKMLVDGDWELVDDTVQAVHRRCVGGGLHLESLDEPVRGTYVATYHDAEAGRFAAAERKYEQEVDALYCALSF